jgi:16S rRNA (guanine(966)-N(2))-methyltransferase RsmD
VRIIAGSARGRQLKNPGSNRIRPTADRIKEALFSILASHFGSFCGLRVLDICAGTGNLGIEALSRGATDAIFVDSSREATLLIKTNLAALGFSAAATVLEMPAIRAIERLRGTNEKPFDLVFCDPPYALALPKEILPLLDAPGILAAGAVVVVEQDRRTILANSYGKLEKFDQREYGDTALFLYTPAPLLTDRSDH